MTLTNKAYDTLKWIAQILLPALATFYFAMARIWNLPYQTEIVGTITALDTLLGMLLGISSHNYEGDGDILINATDEDGTCLSLNEDPQNMNDGELLTLRVRK